MNIILDGVEVDDPDNSEEPIGWWIDGNRVFVRTANSDSVFTLPKRSPRIIMSRLGNGRSQLAVGGWTRTALCVTGPTRAIARLREAVL